MEDKNPAPGVSQPVVSVTEAWLLARAQCLASLAERARAHPGHPMSAEILELSDAAWAGYFEYADVPAPLQDQRDAIRVHLDPSTDIPVVVWPQLEDARVGNWSFVDLGQIEGLDLTMTVPFRQVAVSSLPEETVVVPLTDPRHSAAAALVEMINSGQRDIVAAFAASDPTLAFRRLNRIIQVYRQAAKVTLDQLQRDDFHTWDAKVPKNFSLANAEALICQLGATARSHQVLAVHLLAQWLQALADSKDVKAAPDRKAALLEEVDAMKSKFGRNLEHYNRLACEAVGKAFEACSVMVLLQPVPRTGPVLAFIPAGGDVVPLRAPKAARKKRA